MGILPKMARHFACLFILFLSIVITYQKPIGENSQHFLIETKSNEQQYEPMAKDDGSNEPELDSSFSYEDVPTLDSLYDTDGIDEEMKKKKKKMKKMKKMKKFKSGLTKDMLDNFHDEFW